MVTGKVKKGNGLSWSNKKGFNLENKRLVWCPEAIYWWLCRFHKLISSLEILVQNQSITFVIEIFKLVLFIFMEYLLCDVLT
jgi:hypothetical protein